MSKPTEEVVEPSREGPAQLSPEHVAPEELRDLLSRTSHQLKTLHLEELLGGSGHGGGSPPRSRVTLGHQGGRHTGYSAPSEEKLPEPDHLYKTDP